MAAVPDPLWEIACSLHRFQTRRGRWAYAPWHRTARDRLIDDGLERMVRSFLLPIFPLAAYFPDFLTPAESSEGINPGLEAILAAPPQRVLREVNRLSRATTAPPWVAGLPERQQRQRLVRALRTYHEAVIVPHHEVIQAAIEADRAARFRALLTGGIDALLSSFAPIMQWRPPVLHVTCPVDERELHLQGRGLRLVPSYFCWRDPVPIADSSLPPTVIYPLHHEPPSLPDTAVAELSSLSALLGRTRAAVLHAAAAGATTGELARATGVTASAATRHATALRDAGLLSSHRHAVTVLHTLTPLGASLLRANTHEHKAMPPAPTTRRRQEPPE